MFVQIAGKKLYYETAGTGEPVLLLHGWGVDSSSLRSVFIFVRDELGACPIAPDLPGFGLSDSPDNTWGVSDYAGAVLGLLDALGITRIDVVAHSFGGRIALKMAVAHPQRVHRLVLVGSAGVRPPQTTGDLASVRLARLARAVGDAVPGRLGGRFRAQLQSRVGSADYRAAGALRPTFVRVVNEDITPLLPSVRAPTLLLWGERDDATPLSSARIMREQIPGARLEVLPGAGHYCWRDNWPGFTAALAAFLREPYRC